MEQAIQVIRNRKVIEEPGGSRNRRMKIKTQQNIRKIGILCQRVY